ncbi:hypothetical protein B0H12DRAFT_1078954 [Mycena haematopus]|nr:hypothetical protein B0H12DRAFT_1078954 [Mycena haematopus]
MHIQHQLWLLQLEFIRHLPSTAVDWALIFSAMDAHTLFWVAVQSPIYGSAVVEYIRRVKAKFLKEDVGLYSDHLDNNSLLDKLAPELIQTILEELTLTDLISFGRTARRYRAWAAVIFKLCVADLFRPYHISYDLFRFVQIATGIGLSGSAIPHLVLYSRHAHGSFTPGDLDFYVPNTAWDSVMTFFTTVTAYSVSKQRQSFSYGNSPSISSVVWMRIHPHHPLSLNFMRCIDDNVYGPTVQFHSTCVVGCVTADRAWFPTLDLTVQRITILNRHQNSLRTVEDQRRALVIYRKWQSRGFTIHFDLPYHHECGHHPCCPATVRFSDDTNSHVLCLPLGDTKTGIFQPLVRPRDDVISWTFGGEGCTTARRTPYNPARRQWHALAAMLVNLPADAVL